MIINACIYYQVQPREIFILKVTDKVAESLVASI